MLILHDQGHPTEVCPINSLKTHFRPPRVLLDKIFIWSVILGQLESFRTYTASEYYFPENLRRSLKCYERKTFSDSSIRHIFSSENFRSPFSTKNNLTFGVKFQRLIVGIFLELYLNGTDIQKFLAFFQRLRILVNFCFSKKIFYRKQSMFASRVLWIKV